ncbi:MAG: phenylpyruvate tautomerase MIF-related protein [Bacteroidota bacterium]
MTNFVKDNLEIPADRIFINFINIQPHMWGFNGSTFWFYVCVVLTLFFTD